MNEQEQFLADLQTDEPTPVDVFEQPLVPEEEQPPQQGAQEEENIENDDGGGELKPRNRRERRLMRKLQAERESAMFLSGKLEAREEAKRLVTEEIDYLKAIDRIYGTDTPESQLATDLLKKAIIGAREDAKREALETFKTERERELAAEREAQNELDSFIEDIEDTYDVTLTEPQQKSYFQLLQKMSPKDREGHVVEFADPHAVWEVFSERMKKRGTDNRAKTLSARSMVQSGATKESTIQDDSQVRLLKEMGII